MPTIYTCTMNLAIDLFIETEELLSQKVNRTNKSDIQANGKGVNVSLILKELGISSCALGFSGGFTGRYIAEFLETKNVKQQFIKVDGLTRINVFTKVNKTKEEFKLVNQGPNVHDDAQKELLQQIETFDKGDYLVVSGSLPRGVPSRILVDIARICWEKGVHFIFDVSDPIVRQCLPYHPYLLKPNAEELAAWFHLDDINRRNLKEYSQRLIELGAKRVLLSLGEEGAIFVNHDQKIYRCKAPKGEVVNTACSGDTLLATFLAGLIGNDSIEKTLAKSVAAGSSTAFRSGLTDFSDVVQLEKQINVKMEEK